MLRRLQSPTWSMRTVGMLGCAVPDQPFTGSATGGPTTAWYGRRKRRWGASARALTHPSIAAVPAHGKPSLVCGGMPTTLLDELTDWLRIPSISTGGGDPADIARAADWVVERVTAAGGTAEADTSCGGNPLAVGDLKASNGAAPTLLIYGHYDVQSVGDESAWTTPPFEPTIRGDRIYARGAADDKGNFLPLLHVACELAREGALPVNVRVLVEGEEEAGSEAVAKWIAADERGADCAVVFDGGMADARTPAITVGLRGMAMAHIEVRTGERDLHSGIY